MTDPAPLAIAGGGIGGLTAALALAAEGIPSRVFEKSEQFQTEGAGIQVPPNAGLFLANLGLDQALDRHASHPDFMDVHDWRGRRIISIPFGERFAKRYGAPYRTMHRADLLGILFDTAKHHPLIELHPGQSVVEFALHPRGMTVLVQLAARHIEYPAEALIGADGINSFVRSVMPGGRPRRATGNAAWRTVVPADQAPSWLSAEAIGLWLGAAAHIVHYPVRGGREFNIVIVAKEGKHPPPEAFQEIRRNLRKWSPRIEELLAIDRTWQRWPIGTVHPGGAWTNGPVALLGDAAHAMAPYLAQGGAMAIEDAAVLAHALADGRNDIAGALADYAKARKARVKRLWRAARSTADLYHMSGVTGAMRNTVMRFLGGSGLAWRYRWIYGWQPPNEKARRPKATRSVTQGEVAS